MAIKAFVYERRELSLEAYLAMVLDDFQGNEVFAQRLLREAPKYGTGNAAADQLALRILAFIHRELAPRRNVRGGKFRAAYFSLGNHVIDGFFLGATPDGRRRGMPISNGVSPSNLAETPGGPQAVLRAIAKFPAAEVSSGIALNLRFHPNLIRKPNGLTAFARMVETYFRLGGMQLQPNFVSGEVLRAAQANPADYRDLVVKVSGYSACFVDLGRSIQDDIIARTEFGADA